MNCVFEGMSETTTMSENGLQQSTSTQDLRPIGSVVSSRWQSWVRDCLFLHSNGREHVHRTMFLSHSLDSYSHIQNEKRTASKIALVYQRDGISDGQMTEKEPLSHKSESIMDS